MPILIRLNIDKAPESRDFTMTIAISQPISPARLAANRANAAKSTGPKTPEGKTRSRVNAVKHGLSGAGVAISVEDAAAVAERFEILRDEMGADTMLKVILAKQVALMSVRLDRAAIQESAAISEHLRVTIAEFDQARGVDLTGPIADLEAGSRAGYDRLLGSRSGLDHLIGVLTEIKTALIERDPKVWTRAVGPRLEAYLGHEASPAIPTRTFGLLLATLGDFRKLNPIELPPRDRATWSQWAQTELIATIDLEVARLADLRAQRPDEDDETIAHQRSEAQARALFDPSPEAQLARRYETEARRVFFRSLKEFRTAEPLPELLESEPQFIAESNLDPESILSAPSVTHPALPTRNEPKPARTNPEVLTHRALDSRPDRLESIPNPLGDRVRELDSTPLGARSQVSFATTVSPTSATSERVNSQEER